MPIHHYDNCGSHRKLLAQQMVQYVITYLTLSYQESTELRTGYSTSIPIMIMSDTKKYNKYK